MKHIAIRLTVSTPRCARSSQPVTQRHYRAGDKLKPVR